MKNCLIEILRSMWWYFYVNLFYWWFEGWVLCINSYVIEIKVILYSMLVSFDK